MDVTSTSHLAFAQGKPARTAGSAAPNQPSTGHPPLPKSDQKVEEGSGGQFIKVYTGNYSSGAIHDPEKSERIDTMLNRLSKNEQAALIDNNTLLFDDNFLQMAQELSDEELSQFVAISSAMQTPPLAGGSRNGRAYSSALHVNEFVNNLVAMDAETRTRVLDKAAGYAEKVAKSPPAEPVYEMQDIWNRLSASASADNLFNFGAAITGSDDVNGMLDKLEQFEEPQQKQLLGLIRRDSQLGDRMIKQLEGRDSPAQNAILGYLSELNATRTEPVDYSTYGDAKAVLDFDNNGQSVLIGMMEDTASLLESYLFDDAQLQQMGEQLKHMEVSDQRAYLAISKAGFETLLGSPANNAEQIDLEKHAAAFEKVDSLRSDDYVRELVFKSRMGEEDTDSGVRMYQIKPLSEGERDASQMVELLVTDAWLSDQLDDGQSHTSSLASTLSVMGAQQRDQLVQDLNRNVSQAPPLTALSGAAVQENYGAFFERTSAIANVDDFKLLAKVAEDVQPELRDSFWKAVDLAGERADNLLQMLDENSLAIREQVTVEMAAQASLIEEEQKTQGEVGTQVDQLLDYFKEEHSDKEKQQYLVTAFKG